MGIEIGATSRARLDSHASSTRNQPSGQRGSPRGWPAQAGATPAVAREESGGQPPSVRRYIDRIVVPGPAPKRLDGAFVLAAAGNGSALLAAGLGGVSKERKAKIAAWIVDWETRAGQASSQADSLESTLRRNVALLGPLSDAERSYLAGQLALRCNNLEFASAREAATFLARAAVLIASGDPNKRDLAALRELVSGEFLLGMALASGPEAERELNLVLTAIDEQPSEGLQKFVTEVYTEARGPVWDAVARMLPDLLAATWKPAGPRDPQALREKSLRFLLRLDSAFHDPNVNVKSLDHDGRLRLLADLLDDDIGIEKDRAKARQPGSPLPQT